MNAEKYSPGTRQTVGKNLVWFGEIERKLAKKISMLLCFLRRVQKVKELKLNNRYVNLEYFRKVRWT
jgi:hypothetical protein